MNKRYIFLFCAVIFTYVCLCGLLCVPMVLYSLTGIFIFNPVFTARVVIAIVYSTIFWGLIIGVVALVRSGVLKKFYPG